MNSTQFNVYLGITTLIGFLSSGGQIFYSLPVWLISIGCLILYLGDFWAFQYRIRSVRVNVLFELSGGNPKKRVGEEIDPGCMIFYAFLMRMIFRIVLAMLVILGFSGGELSKELNGVQIGFMIAIVLFELFTMLYSMFELHIFKSTSDKDDENLEEYWEKEGSWRTKAFAKIQEENKSRKGLYANVILLFMAMITTHLFWDGVNQEFIDFIIRTEKFNESVSFAVITVLIASFVLCLFFLMPVRLAFWIEEKMKADTKPEVFKYRLSILFAGISITSPTILQLIKSFLL